MTIIPLDPKTGKPRKGQWVNRYWVPDVPVKCAILPQSNPDFDPDAKYTVSMNKRVE